MQYPKTRAYVRNVQELALRDPSAVSDSDVRKLREIHSAAESGDVSLMERMEAAMEAAARVAKGAAAASFESAKKASSGSFGSAAPAKSAPAAGSVQPPETYSRSAPVPKSARSSFKEFAFGFFDSASGKHESAPCPPEPVAPAPTPAKPIVGGPALGGGAPVSDMPAHAIANPAADRWAGRREEKTDPCQEGASRFEKETAELFGEDREAFDEDCAASCDALSESQSRMTGWDPDSDDEDPVEALNSIELLTASVLTRLQDRYVGS